MHGVHGSMSPQPAVEIRMVPIRIRYIAGGSIGHPVFPANRLTTESRRADSNRRPLLITSDHSGVAVACRGLQIPHIQAVFFAPDCPVLHGIAFPVVSEW